MDYQYLDTSAEVRGGVSSVVYMQYDEDDRVYREVRVPVSMQFLELINDGGLIESMGLLGNDPADFRLGGSTGIVRADVFGEYTPAQITTDAILYIDLIARCMARVIDDETEPIIAQLDQTFEIKQSVVDFDNPQEFIPFLTTETDQEEWEWHVMTNMMFTGIAVGDFLTAVYAIADYADMGKFTRLMNGRFIQLLNARWDRQPKVEREPGERVIITPRELCEIVPILCTQKFMDKIEYDLYVAIETLPSLRNIAGLGDLRMSTEYLRTKLFPETSEQQKWFNNNPTVVDMQDIINARRTIVEEAVGRMLTKGANQFLMPRDGQAPPIFAN